MAKLKNATEADIRAVIAALTDEPLMNLYDINNRMEKGYCDALTHPAEMARALANMAAACSHSAVLILAKLAMQEQKAELEALLKERAALKD